MSFLKSDFTFVDLFAGIGGFRIAMESLGGRCVFSSEIDPHACQMYEANFGSDPYSDITRTDASSIPDFDILCAGFPCQPFSAAGKKEGFLDKTRGTLFFDLARIIREKHPSVLFLENVRNLVAHDHGNTIRVISETLSSLGYSVSCQVLNAKDFSLPQNRERVFIIGSRDGTVFDFSKVQQSPCGSMEPFLDRCGQFVYLKPEEYTLLPAGLVRQNPASGLMFAGYRNKNLRKTGVRPNTEHLSRAHKQPNRIYSIHGTHPTISSSETSGRYWIYDDERVRKLTMDECFRFFGFPGDFIRTGPDSRLYQRIGNSVCIPVVREVGKEILSQLS